MQMLLNKQPLRYFYLGKSKAAESFPLPTAFSFRYTSHPVAFAIPSGSGGSIIPPPSPPPPSLSDEGGSVACVSVACVSVGAVVCPDVSWLESDSD